MVVGVLEVQLRMDGARSLKQKRSILRPLIVKLQREFLVSVAEVDDNDLWNVATIGVACIAPDRTQAGKILQAVTTVIDEGAEYRVEGSREEYL